MTDQERLEKLETRNAYQDDIIGQLSELIYGHQKQLDRLENLVETLGQKLRTLATGEQAPLPEHERPPHY